MRIDIVLKSLFLLFLLFVAHTKVLSQTVSFSSVPPIENGVITVCEGQSVTYTNTSSGYPPNANFNWSFSGGTPGNSNDDNSVTVQYNSDGNYIATLSVQGDQFEVAVNVLDVGGLQATMTLVNTSTQGFSTLQFQGLTYFRYCGGIFGPYTGNIPFNFSLPTYPTGTTINVDWGDGTANTNLTAPVTGNVPHTYNGSVSNENLITITVTLPNGCSFSNQYGVFLGLPPTINISGNGGESCLPNDYTFNLLSNNVPNTEYQIVFSDNSAPITLVTPFSSTIVHQFTGSSCGTNSSIPGPGGSTIQYENAFAATVIATNTCGNTFSTIGPIYVSEGVTANMSVSPGQTVCLNDIASFENTSDPGYFNFQGICDSTNAFFWTISPNTGYTLQAGSVLGDGTDQFWPFWVSGSQTLDVAFNIPGSYTVQLVIANGCNTDTITQTICVVAPIIADFDLPFGSACAPISLTPLNNTEEPLCNSGELYTWTVSLSDASGCSNGTGFTPASSNDFAPEFTFTDAGVYEIQLTASLDPVIPGSQCLPTFDTQLITIKDVPQVSLQAIPDICEGSSFIPVVDIDSCLSETPLTFVWNFNPDNISPVAAAPSPQSSDLLDPGQVAIPLAGSYDLYFVGINECGSDTTFGTVNVFPLAELTASSIAGSCINEPIQLTGTSDGIPGLAVWTSSVPGGVFSPNANDLNAVYTAPLNYTGSIVFTLTYIEPQSPCPPVQVSTTTVVNLNATAEAGTYASLCIDQTLNLSGQIGGAASQATWSSSVGGVFSDINSITSTYTPPSGFTGTLTLTLSTDDPIGPCLPAQDDVVVTVLPPASVNAGPDQLICQSGSTPALGGSFSGTASGVLWSSDQGGVFSPSATVTNPTWTPPIAFNGSAVLTISSTGTGPCPVVTDELIVTANAIPFIADSVLFICSGSSFSFVPSEDLPNIIPAGSQYTWTISDNPFVSGESSSVSPQNSLDQTLINNSNTVQTLSYIVTPVASASGGCSGETFVLSVNILPQVLIDLTPDLTVCNGQSVNILITSSVASADLDWVSSDPSTGTGINGTGSFTFTAENTTNGVISTQLTVNPSFTSGSLTCPGPEVLFSITVNPTPTVDPISDQVLCNGETTDEVIFSGLVPGTVFNWSNDLTSIGLASSGNNSIPSFNALNSGSGALVANVLVVPEFTNGGVTCPGIPEVFTFTVNPSPVVNPIAGLTVCNDGSVLVAFSGTATEFSWSSSDPTIGSGLSGQGDLNFTAINSTSIPVSSQFTVTPSFTVGGVVCTGTSEFFTITVDPTPDVLPSLDQILCNGSAVSAVTFLGSVPGTIFNWTNSDPTIGLPASGSGDISSFNAQNSGPNQVVSTIIVTPQFGLCSGFSDQFTISVSPTPVVTNSILSEIVCSGVSTSEVVWTSSTPGVSFSWTGAVTSGNPSGWILTGTGNLPSMLLTNNDVSTATIVYTILPSVNGCDGPAVSFEITIEPIPDLSPLTDQVICGGTSFVSPVFSSDVALTNYTWTLTNGQTLPATISGYQISGSGQLSGIIIGNTGDEPQILTYIIVPSAAGCDGIGEEFNITVNPAPQVQFSLPFQSICNGNSSQSVSITSPTPGANIVWTITDQPLALQGVTQNNGTNEIPVFTLTHLENVPQTLVFEASASTSGALACPGTPTSYSITVNPSPTVDDPTDQVICNGSTSSAVVFTGTGTSYTWTNNTPSIGLGASGSGNINAFNALNGNTTPLTSTVTVTAQFTGGGTTCPGTQQSFTYTVNPTPSVSDLVDQVVCNGSSTDQVTFGGTGTSYTWTNNTPSIGLSAAGTGQIPSFTAVNTSSVPATATISVTPVFTGSGLSCSGPAQSFTITVNPTPIVNDPSDLVVCANSSTSAVVFSGTGTSYSWTNNTPGIGLGSNGTGNINSFTAINPGITPVVATITVTPDFTGGSASCPGIAQSFTITVNPVPSVNDLLDQTVCNGSSFEALLFTGTGTSYSWTNSLPSIGLSASGTDNISAFTGTNATVSPQSGTLTVTPQYTNAGFTCSGSVQTVALTVNPTPSVTDPQDFVLCNGSSSAAVIFSGTGTSYSWTNSNPLIGLASTGTGNIASFTAVNTSNVPVTATITVVPSYSFNGISCDGPSQVFTITVNPTPSVSDPSDQVLCNGSSTQAVLFNGTGTGYVWTNTTPGIGLAASGTGNIASFTANNSGSAPLTGTITVTPQYTNAGLTCDGTQQQFQITVNPTPIVNDPPDLTFCNSIQAGPIPFSGTGNSYTWTNSLTSIGLAASGAGDIPLFTTFNNSTSLQSIATITVTSFFEQSGVTCQGSTEVFTITVNPTTVLTDPQDQTVCNGLQTSPIVFNGTGTQYQWSNTLPGIGLSPNGIGNIQAFTAVNTGASAVTGVITVLPFYVSADGTSCEGVGEDFSITVNPSPTANPVQDFSVCNNTTINVPLTANMNSNFSWFAESNPNVTGETTLPQPSSVVSNSLVNISANIQEIVYHVIPISAPEGCQGPEILFTVEVVPDVDLILPINYEICSGGFVNAQLISNVPATYTWIATDNSNVTGESVILQGGSFINDQLFNNTTTPQIVIYTVFQTSVTASCAGAIRTIAVLVRPPLDLINDDLVEICSGESVDLLLEANVPANFNWFAIDNPNISGESLNNQNTNLIDDELINNTQEQQLVSYSVVASSQLNGCVSPVFTINVLINPLPQLLNSGVQICSGESTNVDLIANLPSSFVWFAQNAPNVSGETQQQQNSSQINDILVNLSGSNETVIYFVTPTDGLTGCIGETTSLPVLVNPLPVIDFATADLLLCNQAPVEFVNNSEEGLDFYWEFGDGVVSVDTEPIHTYDNPGPYIVTLTGTNPITGCVSSQNLDINLSVSPEVGFMVTENEGCTVFSTLFTDTVNLPGSSILWNFGDGQTSNQPGTVDHQYNEGGCYDVSLTVTSSNGCVSAVVQADYVCVYDVPFAAFIAVSDTMPTTDPVFEFINNSVNAYTYIWDFGDGNTSVATNPIHTFGEEPTSHVITLYAYNEVGCYDSTFYTVVVLEELLVYVPNSFTPNDNGLNDVFLPVMTSGFNRDTYVFTIFNRWGEEVFTTTDPQEGWDGTFEGNEAQTGVYTWRITFEALQNDDAFEYVGHVNLVR